MWCANCKADVAAEFSENGDSVRCTTCGSHLKSSERQKHIAEASRNAQEATHARELLARWSNESLLDSLSAEVDPLDDLMASAKGTAPSPSKKTVERQSTSTAGATHAKAIAGKSEPKQQPVQQVESVLHNSSGMQSHEAPANASRIVRRRVPGKLREDSPPSNKPSTERKFRIDSAHAEPLSADTADIQAAIENNRVRTTNWTSLAGQLLAYAGVLMLTGGASLVIFGYYGQRPDLAPTGWLVSTAGQMLLFLGVITLVSSGLEQTSNEVADRIESLGKRLIRIEQATVRNPNNSKPPANSPTHSDREKVPLQRRTA